LEQLIVKPLNIVGDILPCLIVLDALTKYKDASAMAIIMSSFSCYVVKLSPLKVFVTSRPEQNIDSL